jgi:hypothetical protein
MQLLRVLPLAREQFMSRPTARPHRVQRPSTTRGAPSRHAADVPSAALGRCLRCGPNRGRS